MKLIDNWRCAWRFASVRAMSAALAIQATWLSLPDDLRERIPLWIAASVTGFLLIAGLLGRLIQQTGPDGTPLR